MRNFDGSEAFHQCDVVRNSLLRVTAEAIIYEWDNDNDYKVRNMKEMDERLKNSPSYSQIDITELSSTEMDLLGFGYFNSEMPERLIPLWLFPYVKHGIEVTSIMGNKDTIKPDFKDKDHRFGCMAWGVLPKE